MYCKEMMKRVMAVARTYINFFFRFMQFGTFQFDMPCGLNLYSSSLTCAMNE